MDSGEKEKSDAIDEDVLGNLDKEWASTLLRPSRYFNDKSMSDNAATRLFHVASSFAFVMMYMSGLLSVITGNFCPCKYFKSGFIREVHNISSLFIYNDLKTIQIYKKLSSVCGSV